MRNRKRPIYGTIGSISTDSLRNEDLFAAFLWECKHLRLSRSERNTVRRIDAAAVTTESLEESGETLEDRLQYDVEELQSILENHAAPYMYFGTHPGDGADFGFWLGDLSDFDGLRVDDLSEVPQGHTGEVLHVNDHGNVSLYQYSRGRGREVWAVV